MPQGYIDLTGAEDEVDEEAERERRAPQGYIDLTGMAGDEVDEEAEHTHAAAKAYGFSFLGFIDLT